MSVKLSPRSLDCRGRWRYSQNAPLFMSMRKKLTKYPYRKRQIILIRFSHRLSHWIERIEICLNPRPFSISQNSLVARAFLFFIMLPPWRYEAMVKSGNEDTQGFGCTFQLRIYNATTGNSIKSRWEPQGKPGLKRFPTKAERDAFAQDKKKALQKRIEEIQLNQASAALK